MNPEELKAIQNVSEMLSESQQDFFKLKVSSKHVLFQVQSSLFNSLGGFAIALIAFGLTLGFLELGYYILLPTISLICLLILSSSWQREIIDGSEADLKTE